MSAPNTFQQWKQCSVKLMECQLNLLQCQVFSKQLNSFQFFEVDLLLRDKYFETKEKRSFGGNGFRCMHVLPGLGYTAYNFPNFFKLPLSSVWQAQTSFICCFYSWKILWKFSFTGVGFLNKSRWKVLQEAEISSVLLWMVYCSGLFDIFRNH